MPKTTKSERRALAAMEDAAAAANYAKQVAKTLPAKHARKLRERADEAKGASAVPKKSVRKSPKKVAKRAGKAADRAMTAAENALAKAQQKSAEKAAAEIEAADLQSGGRAAAQKKAAETKTATNRISESTNSVASSDVPHRVIEPVTPAPARTRRPPTKAAPTEDLMGQTVVALRERARAAGRTGYSRLTKAQLVELLS